MTSEDLIQFSLGCFRTLSKTEDVGRNALFQAFDGDDNVFSLFTPYQYSPEALPLLRTFLELHRAKDYVMVNRFDPKILVLASSKNGPHDWIMVPSEDPVLENKINLAKGPGELCWFQLAWEEPFKGFRSIEEKQRIKKAFQTLELGVEVGMDSREAETLLKENGFWMNRQAKHGSLWTDGLTTLQVSKIYGDPRAFLNFKSQVQRAVKRKQAADRPLSQNMVIPMEKNEPKPIETKEQGATMTEELKKKKAQRAGYFKFTAEERGKFDRRVMELYFEGITKPAWIMNRMVDEKRPGPKGTDIRPSLVSQSLGRLLKSGRLTEEHKQKYLSVHNPKRTLSTEQARSNTKVRLERDSSAYEAQFKEEHIQPAVQAPVVQRSAPVVADKSYFTAPTPPPEQERILSRYSPKHKLPDAVVNILTDPELSDTQKIRMIAAWAEI